MSLCIDFKIYAQRRTVSSTHVHKVISSQEMERDQCILQLAAGE